jgi:hypothetical protein
MMDSSAARTKRLSAISLALILALNAGIACGIYGAVRHALDSQAARYEEGLSRAAERVAAQSAASLDREIERLDARIDGQWRDFYEALEARQPALREGK